LHARSIFGAALVILGLLFLAKAHTDINVSAILDLVWPLLFILAGIWLISRTAASRHVFAGAEGETRADESGVIHPSVLFGKTTVDARAIRFRGGDSSVVFGSCVINLVEAELPPGEHRLDLSVAFGETTLTMPAGWAYAVETNVIFGDILAVGQKRSGIISGDRLESKGFAGASARLRISASASFGSIRIMTV
jgi:predicted membrane protein